MEDDKLWYIWGDIRWQPGLDQTRNLVWFSWICVLVVLNIFAKIYIFTKFFRKFSRKLIRKFFENNSENGLNYAKINYFRMRFENFAKEIFRKFGNPSCERFICLVWFGLGLVGFNLVWKGKKIIVISWFCMVWYVSFLQFNEGLVYFSLAWSAMFGMVVH